MLRCKVVPKRETLQGEALRVLQISFTVKVTLSFLSLSLSSSLYFSFSLSLLLLPLSLLPKNDVELQPHNEPRYYYS